jgi:hypothetical protein
MATLYLPTAHENLDDICGTVAGIKLMFLYIRERKLNAKD